jgi:hypothetical protein
MTTILLSLAGIWSLLAVSQLVAFYALLSAKGVSGRGCKVSSVIRLFTI